MLQKRISEWGEYVCILVGRGETLKMFEGRALTDV